MTTRPNPARKRAGDNVRWSISAFFAAEGDLEAARELVGTVDSAELFLYSGDQHLFADSSLSGYDEAAAALLTQRVLEFLDRVG